MKQTKFKGGCCSKEEIHTHYNKEGCDHIYEHNKYRNEFVVDDHFHCYKEGCLDNKSHTHCSKKDCNILDYYKFEKRFDNDYGPYDIDELIEISVFRHIHCNDCLKTFPHYHCDYEECVGKLFEKNHHHCEKCSSTDINHIYCKYCDRCISNYRAHEYCNICKKCLEKIHIHCKKCSNIIEYNNYSLCLKCHISK